MTYELIFAARNRILEAERHSLNAKAMFTYEDEFFRGGRWNKRNSPDP